MKWPEKQKIVGELKDFDKKLKSYNRYRHSKEQLSAVQIRYKDSKAGTIKEHHLDHQTL